MHILKKKLICRPAKNPAAFYSKVRMSCNTMLVFLLFSILFSAKLSARNSSTGNSQQLIEKEYELGSQFLDSKHYEKSYEHISILLYLAAEQKDSLFLAKGHALLASLNIKLKHYSRAIEAYEEALHYDKLIGTSTENFSHCIALTKLYEREKAYKALIDLCAPAIAEFESNPALQRAKYTASVYEMKAILFYAYHKVGQAENASAMLDEIVAISEQEVQASADKHIKLLLGDYFMDTEAYDTAQLYFDEVYASIQASGKNEYLLATVEKLALLAKKKNELEKAVELFAIAMEYNKVMGPVGEDSLPDISDWEDRYKIKGKDIVIHNLKGNQEVSSSKLEMEYKKILTILISSIVLILLSISLYIRKRKLTKRKQILQEENEELHSVKVELNKNNQNLQHEIKAIQKLLKKASLENPQKKYSHSKLSEEQKQHLKNLFVSVLKNDKIFLDSNISLDKLANKLEVNRTYLSQFINEEFEMNFNQLINYYRVIEACKLLSDKNNAPYTIEHIAKVAGFSSIPSFNIAFKKNTKLTPSQFRKKVFEEET